MTPNPRSRPPFGLPPMDALGAIVAIVILCAAILKLCGTPLSASDKPVVSNTTLQSTATSGNGSSVGPGFMSNCRETAVYIAWGASTSAGAVTVETAHDTAYTGTWAPLAVVNWATQSKEDVVQITGVHLAIRARISTTVVGGTVSAYLTCN
jgi:hypothetical protein